MTDLATLTIKIDASDVKDSTEDLLDLAAAARDAAGDLKTMAGAFRGIAGDMGALVTALNQVRGASAQAKAGYWEWVERAANVAEVASAASNVGRLTGALSKVGATAGGAAGALRGAGLAGVAVGGVITAAGLAWEYYQDDVENAQRAQSIVINTLSKMQVELQTSRDRSSELAKVTGESAQNSRDAANAYALQAREASNAAEQINNMTAAQRGRRLEELRSDIKSIEKAQRGWNPIRDNNLESSNKADRRFLDSVYGNQTSRAFMGKSDEQLYQDAWKRRDTLSPSQSALLSASIQQRKSFHEGDQTLAVKRAEEAGIVESFLELRKSAKLTGGKPGSGEPPATNSGGGSGAGNAGNRGGNKGGSGNERAELEASTRQTLALAQAYLQSDAAAMKAEASRRALEGATRGGASAEAHLAHAVAEQALAGAKSVSDLRARAAAQKAANDAVASGKMTSEQAQQAMEASLSLRSLETAKDAASGEQKKALEGIINDLTGATKDWNAEQARSEVLQATESTQRKIDLLNTELEMIGKTNRERAVAIAQKEAEQYLDQHNIKDPEKRSAYITSQVGLAAGTQELRSAQDNYNGSLRFTLDLLSQIHSQAQDVATGLANAFGAPGQALGSLLTSFTGLKVNLEEMRLKYDEMRAAAEAATHSGDDDAKAAATKRLSEINVLAANEEANARRKAYGDMLVAAKGFFKEGSTGWRLMQAAEAGYRAFQLAASIRAIVQNAAETSTSVANAAVRGTADGSAGVAKIFSQLGMWAFPVAAAAIAFMASAGVNARGGGSAPTFDLEAKQGAQGTGSVFGDSTLKSESIQNALEGSLNVQEKMVGYQNSMVAHLRSIDSKIANFANVLTRQITGGRLFSTNGLNLGETSRRGLFGGTTGNVLGSAAGGALGWALGGAVAGAALPGFALAPFLGPAGLILGALAPLLFSSKTTRTLQDQGLQFPDQTVGQIVGSGAQGSSYQQILENTKKKFAGFTYSDKNRTVTDTAPLDDDFLGHIDLIVNALRTGVLSAAGSLGLDGAEAAIDAFKVSLGQISLKDMTGEEIQETLNAVFGKLADDMASAVAGGLIEKYQVLGEGAFETMVRLANGVELVKAQLQATGLAFDYVGAAAVEASQALIDAAGGMDAFADGMAFFREHFLTEAERMGPVIDRVTASMTEFGLAGVDTIDEFKAAVLDAYAAGDFDLVGKLFSVQHDFFDMATYQAKALEDKTKETVEGLAAAFTAQLSAVRGALDDWTGIKNKLLDFQKSLTSGDLSGASGKQSLAMAAQAFEKVAARVAAKDRSALDELPGAGKAYVDALKASARTPEELARGLNRVKAVVGDATSFAGLRQDEAITQLNNINSSVIAVRDAILEMADVPAELAAMVRQGLPGFATGGSFTVGGAGGVDSKLVMFKATPGEVVDIHNGRPPQNVGLLLAANSNGNAAEIAALRADINGLRADNQALMRRVAEAAEKTNITLRRVTRDGDSLVTTAA